MDDLRENVRICEMEMFVMNTVCSLKRVAFSICVFRKAAVDELPATHNVVVLSDWSEDALSKKLADSADKYSQLYYFVAVSNFISYLTSWSSSHR